MKNEQLKSGSSAWTRTRNPSVNSLSEACDNIAQHRESSVPINRGDSGPSHNPEKFAQEFAQDDSIAIPLAYPYVAYVSREDYPLVATKKWRATVEDDGRVYAISRGVHGVRMHRFILGVTNPKSKVDHHDGDGLNNRRRNLRSCTDGQNSHNQRAHIDKRTSIYRGVYKTRSGKYIAQISLNYKKIVIGSFATEADAATAWNIAAEELHGEFARPNIPLAPILPFPSGFAADYSRAVLGGGQ